ncbi:MAG: hypothetical protein HRT68_12065, partial [Flavobacteriaceae bacterium]|nr:hypothetical protein [Flavobacteriaceae bacterium]
AYSVIATSDNGLFMVGFLDITASGGAGNDFSGNTTQHGVGEFWAHKLDANGNLEWRRYFGGTNNDRAYDVIETLDNGYIIAGAAESLDFDISSPNGSYDFWVIKVNNQGGLVWEKSFGGSGFDSARAIKPALDGGIFVSGSTRSDDNHITQSFGQNDFWVLKLSSSGNLEWEQSLGGSGIDFSYDVLQTPDNKVIVVGSSDSTDNQVTGNHGDQDGWIVKLK